MLIVTGPSCAGKTTLGRIAESLGRPFVEGTTIVQEMYGTFRHPDEDMIAFCTRFYRERGEDVFAKANLAKLRATQSDLSRVVFVGPRAFGEVEYFRDQLEGVKLVAVFADPTTRFRRTRIRERDDASLTFEDFIRRDMREYQMGLARLLSNGTYQLILNDGSREEFGAACTTLLS